MKKIVTPKTMNRIHRGRSLFYFFSKVQLVSRLPPLRYRSGLSDPPKAVAPRSVRCINPNLQLTFQTGEIKKRDRPRFQTARFPEFWQSAIPANEGKKNAKTLGSCKPNAHWCANLKARARDRPHKFFDISIAQSIGGKKKLICTP